MPRNRESKQKTRERRLEKRRERRDSGRLIAVALEEREEGQDFLSGLFQVISTTHAGHGMPYDNDSGPLRDPTQHFQQIKDPEDFRRHIGNPTGRR